MIQLYPWQMPSAATLQASLVKYEVAADGSDTGTGKTFKVCHVARTLGKSIVVLCPKAVIPEWKRVAELFGVECIAVNYEKVRTGKSGVGVWQVKGKVFEWNTPNNAILVFDEGHKCGGQATQNATLLIAAKRQRIPLILASATLIGSPLKAYAIGFALGLHRLTNFWPWARANGVTEGFFGPEFDVKDPASLVVMEKIRASLGDKFTRIRKADVPGFPLCQNIPQFVLTEDMPDAESDYGMDARKAVELLKVPGLVEKTKELVGEEDMSVAIFVNFRATLAALYEKFPEAVLVYGGQTSAERQEAIRRFQANEAHVILLMAQAGGTGVSLHDLQGRPRAALICPGYDATEFLQTLGRIHRAGALSPAINFLIFASGVPVERRIRARLEAKLTNLTALNDADLYAQQSPDTTGGSPDHGGTAPDSIAGAADEHRQDLHPADESVGGPSHGNVRGGGGTPGGPGHEGGPRMNALSTLRAKIITGPVIDVEATTINNDQPAPPVAPPVEGTPVAHVERKHARSSPSKLKNLEICPSYEGDNDGPVHPVTLRGTAMHEALETNDDTKLIEGEQELVDMCREFLKDEIEWAAEVITESHLKTHDPDVQGFVDLFLIGPTETRLVDGQPKAFRRAKIRDFKMGWNLVDLPNINPQAIAYTVGAFIGDPLIEEINFAFLIPRQDAVLEHTFHRSELPELKLRLSVIAERVRKLAGKEFNVNTDNCLYCGRKATCAALHAKVLTIANGFQTGEEKLALPSGFVPDLLMEPKDIALGLNMAGIAEDWAQKMKGYALRYRLELGQEIPGYDLIERQGKREVSDPVAAFTVAKEFGVTEFEYLSAAKVSVTQLDTLVKDHADQGDKAKAAGRFTDRLMDANALTRGGSFHVLQKSRKKAKPAALPAAA